MVCSEVRSVKGAVQCNAIALRSCVGKIIIAYAKSPREKRVRCKGSCEAMQRTMQCSAVTLRSISATQRNCAASVEGPAAEQCPHRERYPGDGVRGEQCPPCCGVEARALHGCPGSRPNDGSARVKLAAVETQVGLGSVTIAVGGEGGRGWHGVLVV